MVAVGTGVVAAISAEDLLMEALPLACMLALGTVAAAISAEDLLREALPLACMLALGTVAAAMSAGDLLRGVLVLAIIHRRVLDGAAAEGVNEMGLGDLLCGTLR